MTIRRREGGEEKGPGSCVGGFPATGNQHTNALPGPAGWGGGHPVKGGHPAGCFEALLPRKIDGS